MDEATLKALDELIESKRENVLYEGAYSSYLHGMVNGMIYVRSLITGNEPIFHKIKPFFTSLDEEVKDV